MYTDYPTDCEIHAYVDLELDASRAQTIKEQAVLDPELGKRISEIRALKEQLAHAFDDSSAAGSDHASALDLADIDRSALLVANATKSRPTRSGAGVFPLIIVGTLLGGMAMGYVTGQHQNRSTPDDWVAQMVSYQEMYTQATIAAIQTPNENPQATQERLSVLLGSAFVIPDLASKGLTFKRAQVLQSQNKPVIQLAYQDEASGEPVAVCITRLDNAATQAPAAGTDRSVNYVAWQEEHLGFVLVGRQQSSTLSDWVTATQVQQTASL